MPLVIEEFNLEKFIIVGDPDLNCVDVDGGAADVRLDPHRKCLVATTNLGGQECMNERRVVDPNAIPCFAA